MSVTPTASGMEAVAFVRPANFATFLRSIIFIGETAFGTSLDFESAGLCRELSRERLPFNAPSSADPK